MTILQIRKRPKIKNKFFIPPITLPFLKSRNVGESGRDSALRPHTQSFTLIELLLVVVILGVLMGLALPNFSRMYTRFQVNEAAKDIASFLRYTQTRAVIHKKIYQVEFDTLEHFYRLKEENPENKELPFKEISGRYGRTFSLPPEVQLEAEKPFIRFYPDGKIDKARLILSDKEGHYFTVSTREQSGYIQLFDFKVE